MTFRGLSLFSFLSAVLLVRFPIPLHVIDEEIK